jgi:hypothetical protein
MHALTALPLGFLFLVVASVAGSPHSGSPLKRADLRLVQSQPAEPTLSSQRTVNLNEEQRHTIRETVLKAASSDKQPAGLKIQIGDMAPANVTTRPFPAEVSDKIPALKAHNYFIVDDEVVLVDAKDGKIADIVK